MCVRPPKTYKQTALLLISCVAAGIYGWPLLSENIGLFHNKMELSQFVASALGVAVAQAVMKAIEKIDLSGFFPSPTKEK